MLDVACGAGRHARWFAARGHDVTAVDRDLSRVEDLADEVRLIQANLEDGSPWPVTGERFDCIVVINYLWRPLFPALVASLAADGILIYETFARGNEKLGKPSNPDFLLREDELLDACRDLEVLAFEQGFFAEPRASVKQRICAARRLAPK